jgi:hypothetical protein
MAIPLFRRDESPEYAGRKELPRFILRRLLMGRPAVPEAQDGEWTGPDRSA